VFTTAVGIRYGVKIWAVVEHFVLNEMQAHMQAREVRYWRDKRGHEVDFVLARRGATASHGSSANGQRQTLLLIPSRRLGDSILKVNMWSLPMMWNARFLVPTVTWQCNI